MKPLTHDEAIACAEACEAFEDGTLEQYYDPEGHP